MRLLFEVSGDRQIDRELLRFGGAAADATPAFLRIADLIRAETREQFASEGGHASGGWKPLAASTAAQKRRRGLRPEILQATGALLDSLTVEHDGNQVLEVTPLSLTFGSKLPYAEFHQTGTRRMPRRRPLEFTEQTRRLIVKILQAHLVASMRDTGAATSELRQAA